MNHFYIGIDIGTTATKAIVFTNEGKMIQQYSKEYEMYHPEPDWSIQKPAEILEAVLETVILLNMIQTRLVPLIVLQILFSHRQKLTC